MLDRHAIVLFGSCCLLGCSNGATPVCPPAPAPATVAATPTPDPAAVEPEPEPEPVEPEPSEPAEVDSDLPTATLDYNSLKLALRVGEREPEGEDGDPAGFVRLEVRNSRTDGGLEIERPAEFSACFLEQVEPEIDVIFSDEELVVLDAKYTCVWGETVRHVDTQHLVVALEYGSDDSGILYEGTSTARDNRRLAVEVDRREFYVEAGKLAIYRHFVAWCDRKGLELLTGAASCRESPRKLKLLERVGIGVAPSE